MRDLSQLYAFEKLLDEANNELVRAGVVRGLHPIGSVCSLAPAIIEFTRMLFGSAAGAANRID